MTPSDEIVPFVATWLNVIPRMYQQALLRVMVTAKRIAIRWPRQCGKTTTVGWYCIYKCVTAVYSIIIVAPAQRQSAEFYSRVVELIKDNPLLQAFVVNQTQTEITFANGSTITALPVGPTGKTIKGKTCDCVIIEEAGYMSDAVINGTVLPFIASKGNDGVVIKLGTPFAKTNFYESCKSPDWYESHITWRNVLVEGGYSKQYLREMRATMTDTQWQTEYEAEFVESADCYFKPEQLQSSIMEYQLIQPTEVYAVA